MTNDVEARVSHLQDMLTAPDLSERDIELIERRIEFLRGQQPLTSQS